MNNIKTYNAIKLLSAETLSVLEVDINKQLKQINALSEIEGSDIKYVTVEGVDTETKNTHIDYVYDQFTQLTSKVVSAFLFVATIRYTYDV